MHDIIQSGSVCNSDAIWRRRARNAGLTFAPQRSGFVGKSLLLDVPGNDPGDDGSEGDVLDEFGGDACPNIDRKNCKSLDSIIRCRQ